MKFDIRVENIENIQFDDYIFKLYRPVNFFSRICS